MAESTNGETGVISLYQTFLQDPVRYDSFSIKKKHYCF